MMTHRCGEGGAVVPGAAWLPSDPHDFGWAQLELVIGCNHLVCGACGADVTSAPTEDGGRRYTCGCASEVVYAPRRLDPRWGTGPESPVAWGCAGHPALTLPAVLDGVALDHAGLAAAAEAALEGVGPEPWAGSEPVRQWQRHPGFAVARLKALVADDAAQAVLDRVVDAALDDARPEVRRRALCVLEHNAVSTRPAALMRADLASASPRFAGVPDPLEPRDTLWLALADAVIAQANAEGPGPAVAAAWEALLAGKGTLALLWLVGRTEPARVAERAAALLQAGMKAPSLLTAVRDDAAAAEALVRVLHAAGVPDLGAHIDKKLDGEARTRAQRVVASAP